MSLPSLLKKEVLWSRHRILTLVLLLVLLPGFFAATTVVFETVVPKDAPIAIVPQNDDVSADGLAIIEGGAATFSDPELYENESVAMAALQRESVYAVLTVPPGILDENTSNATFELQVDGSLVPFKEPSKAIRGILGFHLDRQLPADVSVERTVIGEERTLSEYLLPVFLMGLIMLFAFTYVPYNVAREADVLDRLLVETTLDAVVTSKIAFQTLLMLVPIAAFHLASVRFGYAVDLLSPGVLVVYLLTFVYLSAISTSVMLVTRFTTLGRFINVVLLFAGVTFSSLMYPVGFFSPLRRTIARLLPLHHSMIVARSLSLKEVSTGLYLDRLLLLVGFTAVCAVVLKLSIERYKRTV